MLGYGGAYAWVLDGIDAFRLHLAFAASFLALAALVFRLWRAAFVSVAAAVLAAAGLGPVFDDPISADPSNGPEIVLVYANLYDANPTPEAAAKALLEAGADVLVTSETTAQAAKVLRAAYRYRVVKQGDGPLRTAIWSRLPLRNEQLFLNNNVSPTGAAAVVELGDAELHLTGVHFSRAIEGLRAAQADGLGEITKATGLLPRIVIGDFNAAPWAWTLTRAAHATGTRVMGGHRVTWTGDYPTPGGTLPTLWGHGIDHMLHSAAILVRAVDTLAVPGSDHRALWVQVQVMQE